jgi:hypothetical protein
MAAISVFLRLLELDQYKNYFILALSSKIKFNPGEEKYGNISELIPKNGEIKLIKSTLNREVI